MASTLAHSPAAIIRKLLIDLGLGAEPTPTAAWPVYDANEPTSPDNCITVYDTQGIGAGRSMIDGELLGFNGFQVRVRGVDHPTGWTKADAIQTTLAKQVLRKVVHVGASNYLVHAASRIGDVLALGKDPDSKRRIFTLNAIAAIKQL